MSGLLHVVFAVFFLSTWTAVMVAGGFLVLLDDPIVVDGAGTLNTLKLAMGGLGAVALATGGFLAVKQGRVFAFRTIQWSLLTIVTLGLCEIAAGFLTPPWLAASLHGVAPSDLGGWAQRAAAREGAVGVNSWGQRDGEHSVAPPEGKRRIVFIGDSFLEEASTRPLPLSVERILARPEVETINLGVSATAPDEYYWRLRNVALPLKPERIVVVIYSGNDFIGGPTLWSFMGIAAPSPRDSVLSRLGLGNLNHALTNPQRPVLQAWRGSGDLAAQENGLSERIKSTPDAEMPGVLAQLAPVWEREAAKAFLQRLDLGTFYTGLRNPDAGLFRSTYLRLAMESLGPPKKSEVSVNLAREAYVLGLVERMATLCRDKGVDFTLVIAPEATHVDPRFRGFWGRISHLSILQLSEKALAGRLLGDARAKGIEVFDLTPALEGVPGTYYNMDGHWSDLGVETSARALAGFLQVRLDMTSSR